MITTLDTKRSAGRQARSHPDLSPYLVRPGDTLESIAAGLGIDEPDLLAELNPGLLGGRSPQPGTILFVPTPVPGDAGGVHTAWTNGFGRDVRRQNEFNSEIAAAGARWPELPPEILKSIFAQESGFSPQARNRYGYSGIAQLGVAEARSVGLTTGASRMASTRRGVAARFDLRNDERFVPARAIAGAAALLRKKAESLEGGVTTRSGTRLSGFSDRGRPQGDDYWRFVAAAYNAGEGTILHALRFAYGDSRPAAVRWDDLVRGPRGDIRQSPLWQAIEAVGMNPHVKYREVTEYARDVLLRARQ